MFQESFAQITGSYHKVFRKRGTTSSTRSVEQTMFQEPFAQEHMCVILHQTDPEFQIHWITYSATYRRRTADTRDNTHHRNTNSKYLHIKCPRKQTAPGTSETVKLKVHCRIHHRRTLFLDTDLHTHTHTRAPNHQHYINTARIHHKWNASLYT